MSNDVPNGADQAAGDRRRVLFVCTANICRSPTAEYIARGKFERDRFHFRSAGFMEAGRSCPPDLRAVLEGRNIDVSPHRSYHLDRESVTAADLILTMEARHVLDATVLDRRALRKMLPLREAAERTKGSETVEEFLERLNTKRDTQRYLSESRYDIDDPYGKKQRAYERAVDEIDELVERLFTSLT